MAGTRRLCVVCALAAAVDSLETSLDTYATVSFTVTTGEPSFPSLPEPLSRRSKGFEEAIQMGLFPSLNARCLSNCRRIGALESQKNKLPSADSNDGENQTGKLEQQSRSKILQSLN